jgi:hypothetical protein
MITERHEAFMAAVMNTPFGAVCVKKRGKELRELFDDEYGHGILVSPTILQGTIHGPDELAGRVSAIMLSDKCIVKVRGHGWDSEKRFVWTGTVEEFNRTWVVD